MNEKILKLIEKFDLQPIRIRLLFTFVSIALVALLVDSLWIADSFNRAKTLKSELSTTDENINELIAAQNALNQNVLGARNNPLLKELEQVEIQISKMKLVLDEKTINLIKPELMSAVLNDIIHSSKKLKLLSLTKQAPAELFDSQNNEQQTQIYRHFVELVFEGQYSDTQNFLVLLENMPQKINFESLDYEVTEHPLSKIKLTVSTLSFDRKWIGG